MSSEDDVPVNNSNKRRFVSPVVTGEQWFNYPKQNQPIIFTQNSGLKCQTSGHEAIDYFNLLVSNDFYN